MAPPSPTWPESADRLAHEDVAPRCAMMLVDGRRQPTRAVRSPHSASQPARSRTCEVGVRVYISVDMEGIAGVSHTAPTTRGDSGYPAAVRLMDGETNAAIAGAFDGGATEVIVNDSHGSMYNLTPEAIDHASPPGPGPQAPEHGPGGGRWTVPCGALRRLPRQGRASHGHHRAYLHRRPDAHDVGGSSGRRVRHQCPVPGRAGRAGGHGRWRRRARG